MVEKYNVNVTFSGLKNTVSKDILSDAENAAIAGYNQSILDEITVSLYKEYGIGYDTFNIQHNTYGLISSIVKRIAIDSGLLKGRLI